MPIDPELLEILVCPETKQPVQLAGEDVLKSVNEVLGATVLVVTHAAATAVEASETYKQAAKIVSQGGEMNDPGAEEIDPDSIEFEDDDYGSERQADTEE